MQKMGKLFSLAILFCIVCFCNLTAFGYQDSDKPITGVHVSIDSNIPAGTLFGQENITITTPDNVNYYFQKYEIVDEGDRWELGTHPQFKISLAAREGYYFRITKASQITLSGDVKYVAAAREYNGYVLTITIKTILSDYKVGKPEFAKMEGGICQWGTAYNAGSYEIRVYRDNSVLSAVTHTEPSTSFLFDTSKYMTREGNYSFEVRAFNAYESTIASDWVKSNPVFVSAEQAAQNKAAIADAESAGNWEQTAEGWKFKIPDGSYAIGRRTIDGADYYFNSAGVMATGWQSIDDKWYYFDTNGVMLKGSYTPDGYWMDEHGVYDGKSSSQGVS